MQYESSFDEWLVDEGMRYEKNCRECGLPASGTPRISELPKEGDPTKSAAYVEQLCARGHVVKTAIMSWALLEKLQSGEISTENENATAETTGR